MDDFHADDGRVLSRTGEPPAAPSARFHELCKTESERITIGRRGDRVGFRIVVGTFFQSAGDARIQRYGGNDRLTVFQLEKLLYRLAISRGRRNVDDPAGICSPIIREKHHTRLRRPCDDSEYPITLSQPSRC